MRSFSPLGANGELLPAVAMLFAQLGYPITDLASAVAISQSWVSSNHRATSGRKLERHEFSPLGVNMPSEQCVQLTRGLGFIEPWQPRYASYDHLVIPGGLTLTMRHMLANLVELHQGGLVFDNLVLLGGNRSLDPDKDSLEMLIRAEPWALPWRSGWTPPGQMGQTETDALLEVWNQSDMPGGMPAPLVIDAGSKAGQRTTTVDQFEEWLATRPKPGRVLMLTRQPGCHFQHMAVQVLLPAGFELDTCGFGGEDWQLETTMVLGAVARWLWEWR